MPLRGGSRGGSRGSDNSHRSTPSPLSSRRHEIMDAFLWNNENAKGHELKEQEEARSLILSKLKRPPASASAARPVRGVHQQARVFPSSRQQPQREAQSRVVQQKKPELVSPMNKIMTSKIMSQRSDAHRAEEMQRLLPMQPQLRSMNVDNNITNGTSWNAWDQQTTMNHRSHNRHMPADLANNNRQMEDRISVDDDEEDIACCEGGHCHEGTKNLCTIALWAVIVFAMVNRFFVHMAMHLHKPQHHVTHKDFGTVAAAADGGYGRLDLQPSALPTEELPPKF